MNKLSKNQVRLIRKRRVRAKVKGTKDIPRLAIYRSLKNIYVQAIDDDAQKTLAFSSLKETGESKKKVPANNLKNASKLGELMAQKCIKLKIKKVVFDRGGYRYHGRVKALAEGARKAGLEI
jgi:large subunit ribosomal protein L18